MNPSRSSPESVNPSEQSVPPVKEKPPYPWGLLMAIVIGTMLVTGGIVHTAKLSNGDYLRDEINNQSVTTEK